MVHCDLCNKNTRCSCKWGGCPGCWSSNKQVSVMNDLLKFWTDKNTVRANFDLIKKYVWKIDSYTLYEFISWAKTEEEFNTALEQYVFHKPAPRKSKNEVVDTTWRVNPERYCVFDGNSPRDRCIYCNSIRKYIKGQTCPKYKETLGDTVAENK